MRSILSALVIAAGLAGATMTAQATPLQAALPVGAATTTDSGLIPVQMTPGERRMMRRHQMRRHMRHERRMMRHERRMMHRDRMHRRMMNRM